MCVCVWCRYCYTRADIVFFVFAVLCFVPFVLVGTVFRFLLKLLS